MWCVGERVREAAEEWWKWLMRGLAVYGFVLIANGGFKVPLAAYLLLTALFFGPEAITGQLRINRQSRKDDE